MLKQSALFMEFMVKAAEPIYTVGYNLDKGKGPAGKLDYSNKRLMYQFEMVCPALPIIVNAAAATATISDYGCAVR